jgi:LysM repeat protein
LKAQRRVKKEADNADLMGLQRDVLKLGLSNGAPASPTRNTSPASTAEITVGPGDSLNELARRFNTTAGRLKELNPTFNWPRIQAGQQVIIPAPAGG